MKECIHQYAKSSKQENTLFSDSYFRIARILRNAVAHNYRISLDTNDIKALPIEFCGVEYNKNMNDKDLTFEMINPYSALMLFKELKTLVETKLY